MELMLSVAINFINEAASGSSFFSPFPLCSHLSEMWKSFNPLSFLTRLRLSFSVPLAHTEIQKSPCVCSQGRAGSPGNHLIPDNTTQPWYQQSAFSRQLSYNIGQTFFFFFGLFIRLQMLK